MWQSIPFSNPNSLQSLSTSLEREISVLVRADFTLYVEPIDSRENSTNELLATLLSATRALSTSRSSLAAASAHFFQSLERDGRLVNLSCFAAAALPVNFQSLERDEGNGNSLVLYCFPVNFDLSIADARRRLW